MALVAILEIVIGLIFAWLIISIAGMYIQEWIVSLLDWRPRMLENTIGNMLTDSTVARQLYDHPLIQALHNGPAGEKRPSFIPPSQFSMALVDLVKNSSKEASIIQNTLYDLQKDLVILNKSKRAGAQKQLDEAIVITRKAIAVQNDPELVNELLDEVKKLIRKLSTSYPELQPAVESRFLNFATQKKQVDTILANFQLQNPSVFGQDNQDEFRSGLAVMSATHPDLKQALTALGNDISTIEDQTHNAIGQWRKNIETWFTSSMDRLSGWYKRRSQVLAFLIGVFLAVFLNIDSIEYANQLWRDPIVRESLAAQANAFVQQNPGGISNSNLDQLISLNLQINQLNIPVGWIGTALTADSNGGVFSGDGSMKHCTLTPKTDVDIFGFFFANQCYPVINTPHFNDLTGWLIKLLGLLITSLAAAQGAPFWFDILKRVVNIRSTGPNTSSTPANG